MFTLIAQTLPEMLSAIWAWIRGNNTIGGHQHIPDHIKAVIFDYDNTLIETFKPRSELHKHIAKTVYGKILTDEEIKRAWGRPIKDLVCLLYGVEEADEILGHLHGARHLFPKHIYESTEKVLSTLKASGKKLGIVTAAHRATLERDATEINFPFHLIDYVQTFDDTEYHKPDPQVFEPTKIWLAGQGIKPEETIYIGDDLVDIAAALGAGFNFLGVETGIAASEEFIQKGGKSVADISHLLHMKKLEKGKRM